MNIYICIRIYVYIHIYIYIYIFVLIHNIHVYISHKKVIFVVLFYLSAADCHPANKHIDPLKQHQPDIAQCAALCLTVQFIKYSCCYMHALQVCAW